MCDGGNLVVRSLSIYMHHTCFSPALFHRDRVSAKTINGYGGRISCWKSRAGCARKLASRGLKRSQCF